MKNNIFVIIGFNTSAYGFARSLHKTYGIIPYVFGDEKETSPIRFSTIVHCVAVQNFRDKNVFCRVLIDFVTDHTKKYILLSGSELNLYHIELHYDELSKYYTIPYPKPLLVGSYFDKSLAMTVCQQADIAYPQSIVVSDETLDTYCFDSFTFPVILKPSVSALYKTIEFENKSKNYLIDTQDQLFSTINKIREAGYQASFLVQEIIPSSQYNEYSVNGFIDHNGHLRAISFGRALLGWPNATRRGNHLVIVNVTTDEQEILLRLTQKYFETHAYYGLFNIDFIQNSNTNDMILLEFNPRQGRSHFYTELSGVSLVEAVLDDTPFSHTVLPSRPFVWLDASLNYVSNHLSQPLKNRLNLSVQSDNVDATWTYPFDLENSDEFRKLVQKKIANIDKQLDC